ncbi:MAG: EamA family transporter [Alphaproteobacteria bacterium]|nr:EamA family transporter [Alphaproteobacteria bacterium]
MFTPTHTWFWLAVGASVVWGLVYAVSEKIMKAGVSPTVYMLLISFLLTIFFAVLAYLQKDDVMGQINIILNSKTVLLLFLLALFCYMAGDLLIYNSIKEKNATISSMIEISYPLFTFLFCWLLFKEVQINLGIAIGGLLVIAGVTFIFLKS